MAQPLMGLPRQPFRQSSSFPGAGENDMASQLFDQFCSANTFQGIMDTFQQMCHVIGLHPVDHQIFYRQLKTRLLSWKAQSLWSKLDKRSTNIEYKKGTACNKTRTLVIGCGPCGLRVAIEIALLGGKVVIVEKREGFSRNNVLHLWPFLIHDLKALGAKKFFGKFCAGAIDHISIRALQCILLKVALLVGVEVHSGVTFEGFSEPPSNQTVDTIGWRAKVSPEDHPVSEFVFDVCISADGRRNTMTEFKRKEFRGKLAIAITANFINRRTKAEASVEEISGVAYIFNQKFFKDLNHHAGIDLENIVYYKDETHYFVMTAKKQSLLCKGVLLQDYDDPEILLSKENVDQQALLEYARQAADMSTQHRLPNLDFAHNHYGQPDVAMFDFTSMFAAEHACRIVERQGYKLLVALVGDTLLEPFWPTGSGCARGFLGAFDVAWMIRSWSSGKMTPLEVIAERESIYQLLSQTTPENLNKNYLQYTIDPNTRYLNLNTRYYKPHQVASQYDGHDKEYLNEIVRLAEQQGNRYDSVRDSHNLLKWIQRQLEPYHTIMKVNDFSNSWRSGLALCALIHQHRPELLDIYSLDPNCVETNNQLAFDVIEREFGVLPIMTGLEMAQCEAPDKMAMASYLSLVCSTLRKETANAAKVSENKSETAVKPSEISLTKIGNLIQQRREEMERSELSSLKRFQDPLSCDVPSKRVKELSDGNSSILSVYGKFENLVTFDEMSKYANLQKDLRLLGHGIRGQNKVSVLAKDLASKLSGEANRLAEESATVSKKTQPTDSCYFCKGRVYTVERYTAEGLFFHRECFRCDYCGSSLRISYYSFKETGNGEGKFYCVQHHGLQRSAQTSSSERTKLATSKDTSVTRLTVPSSKMSTISGKDPTTKRTSERIEYVTESEVEESEFEQTKHNLCSVLRPSAFSDSDSSSEEELHFSDEEASDEQPDLTWAELARKYGEQLSKTKMPRPPQKRTSSASSGSETETVDGASDADWETDSNTDKENITEESDFGASRGFGVKQRGSRDEFSKHLLSLSPRQNIRLETKPSPTSVEIMRNKMAFFSTVSQPVRIDARAFLGLAPPPLVEEEKSLQGEENIIESEMKDQHGENFKAEETKESNGALQQIKPENGIEERPLKRRTEKKPVIQKAKKRTKRRKKEEKSRVTANVGSTKLSTMHEAVPVVAISGATSSDEQCDMEMIAVATQLSNAPKENFVSKPRDSCSEDDVAEKEDEKMLEERDEFKQQDISDDRHLAEDGSSQSKSTSENSQTLQYSESEEDLNPLRETLCEEPVLESKRSAAVLLESSVVENGDLAMQPNRRMADLQDSATTRDLSLSGEKSEQLEERMNTKKSVLEDHSNHETDDDQKPEHEYVTLEEHITHSEGGKFTPYEELVTDGSDKEYTEIQLKPLDDGREIDEKESLHLDNAACQNGDYFDQSKRDNSLMVPEEENCHPWIEAVENLEGTEDRQTFPVKTVEVLDDSGVHISACTVLQSLSKPNGIKVAAEENLIAVGEVIGHLADVEESTNFPLKSMTVIDETGVQAKACDALCMEPSHRNATSDIITGIDDVNTLDTDVSGSNQGGQKTLDPLSRINLLLESLSVSKAGIPDSRPEVETEQEAHSHTLKSSPEDEDSRKRPSSRVLADNGVNGEIAHYDRANDVLEKSRSLEFTEQKLQKPGGNEVWSDSSICNASITSGSVDFRHELNSSADQLSTGSVKEGTLALENAVETNTGRKALTKVDDNIRSKEAVTGNRLLNKRLEIQISDCRDSTAVEGATTSSSSIAAAVLSPNRIMDAKRKFFFDLPQPVRIDPRQVIKDIPSAKQPAVAKEVTGEESSVISGESDSISRQKDIVCVGRDLSVLSSGSETGIENGSFVGSLTDSQGTSVSGTQVEASATQEQKRVLPTLPSAQSPQPVSTVDASAALPTTRSSIPGKFKVQESDLRMKKPVLKEKIRPNSAFVSTEESFKLKGRGASFGLGRPISAKQNPLRPGQKSGSPVRGTEVSHALPSHVSQSDGASTEEMSPSLAVKDKESRLKNLYHLKSKGKDSATPASKEGHDKKDKRKSLLAILIPSRGLDKKEKSTKSPILQSKSQQHQPMSKPTDAVSMAAVREKTKSLPLEKKQLPSMTESKKLMGEKSKGKVKSRSGKTAEEPPETGHGIYKEMAGIMEGIKKVEKRNRDKISIRDRIEAVAPPPAKAPYTVLLPPKADTEDFETESELGDDRLSLRSFQSQMHLLSEEEVAKLKKRQQKAAKRKQREKEVKRLHAAQEIQQQLEEVEMRQREIERLGVEIEKALNGEDADKLCDEATLVQQWFDIVYERNVLVRYESELMVQARELELEDRQSRLEIQLRERIPHAESQKTESLEEEEQRILQELMEVVEQRNALVVLLDEDRIRQQQYSKNLERIMVDRGFQLSPISHMHLPQSLAALQEDR